MRATAILATIDEYFARDWNKVLVVPYVAHAMMTRWRKEPLPPRRDLAVAHPVIRRTKVPSGSSDTLKDDGSHHVDLKKHETHRLKRKKREDRKANVVGGMFEVPKNSEELRSWGNGTGNADDERSELTEEKIISDAGVDVQGDDAAQDVGDNGLDDSEVTALAVPVDLELESINRNVTFFFRGGILHGVDCKRKVKRG
jgi:hypothetical protein